MTTALNKAMGWIVAAWIVLAMFADGYAPYACLGGALATVLVWAALAKWLRLTDG